MQYTVALFSAALKDVLEKRGVLSEVRAKLRSEVYKSLDDQVKFCAIFVYVMCVCW